MFLRNILKFLSGFGPRPGDWGAYFTYQCRPGLQVLPASLGPCHGWYPALYDELCIPGARLPPEAPPYIIQTFRSLFSLLSLIECSLSFSSPSPVSPSSWQFSWPPSWDQWTCLWVGFPINLPLDTLIRFGLAHFTGKEITYQILASVKLALSR